MLIHLWFKWIKSKIYWTFVIEENYIEIIITIVLLLSPTGRLSVLGSEIISCYQADAWNHNCNKSTNLRRLSLNRECFYSSEREQEPWGGCDEQKSGMNMFVQVTVRVCCQGRVFDVTTRAANVPYIQGGRFTGVESVRPKSERRVTSQTFWSWTRLSLMELLKHGVSLLSVTMILQPYLCEMMQFLWLTFVFLDLSCLWLLN